MFVGSCRSLGACSFLGGGALLFVVACGGAAPEQPGEEGASGEEGGSETASSGGGKAPSNGGRDEAPPGAPSEGPPGPPQDLEGPPSHIPVYAPGYLGVDEALVPEAEVPGCQDGFDEESAAIVLSLDEEAYGVWLHAEDGGLFANGQRCTKADGSALSLTEIQLLSVHGGGEDNVVLMDFSKEAFPENFYDHENAFYFDLAGGKDTFQIRGSSGDDRFHASSGSNSVMMALTTTARVNLWVKYVEFINVSLGDGDDSWIPVTRLNVGIADVDTGAAIRATDLKVPLTMYGGPGADVLRGGEMADWISGGDGADIISGAEGNDHFEEGAAANGNDVINGGPGLDSVSYYYRTGDVTLSLCMADTDDGCLAECACDADDGEGDEGDTIVNIETGRTGAGNDILRGTDGDDYMYGEGGDDVLSGLGGSDVLQGGRGTDRLDGGEDADICDADPGEPTTGCEI